MGTYEGGGFQPAERIDPKPGEPMKSEAQEKLRGYVNRVRDELAFARRINRAVRDALAQAQADGFDAEVISHLATEAVEAEDHAEFEATVNLYRDALA